MAALPLTLTASRKATGRGFPVSLPSCVFEALVVGGGADV